MSNSYTYQPTTSSHGKYVQQMSSAMDQMLTFWGRNMATFIEMLDGDGTQDAHYATFKTKVGCPDDATAHALFVELNTAYQKFSGDGQVSGTNSALKQVVARTTA